MSNKKQNKRQIVYNKISDIFRNNPTKSFNYRQISHAIGLNRKEDKNAVGDILLDMAEQKIIRQVSQGKFIANITAAYITGTIDRQSVAHKTYLVPDDGSESVFIAERSSPSNPSAATTRPGRSRSGRRCASNPWPTWRGWAVPSSTPTPRSGTSSPTVSK